MLFALRYDNVHTCKCMTRFARKHCKNVDRVNHTCEKICYKPLYARQMLKHRGASLSTIFGTSQSGFSTVFVNFALYCFLVPPMAHN